MKKFVSKSLLALAGLSLLAVSSMPAEAMVPINTAVIINSGSTNTIGYRIYVAPTGQVTYVDGKGSGSGTISAALTTHFFNDIKAAQPLSQLSDSQPCMKSVSFGTSTYLALGGQRSPDLSCSDNQKGKVLLNDVQEIAQKLHVTNVPRSQGHQLPPINF